MTIISENALSAEFRVYIRGVVFNTQTNVPVLLQCDHWLCAVAYRLQVLTTENRRLKYCKYENQRQIKYYEFLYDTSVGFFSVFFFFSLFR